MEDGFTQGSDEISFGSASCVENGLKLTDAGDSSTSQRP